MKNDKLLRNIELELDFLQAHVRRISKNNKKIHPLDRDMLINKTRSLYEKLLKLEEPEEKETPEKSIKLPETMPEAELSEKAESSKHIEKGGLVPDKKVQEAPSDETPSEEPVVKTAHEEHAVTEERKDVGPGKNISADEPENKGEEKPSGPAFDLFSPAEETISDIFSQKEEPTLAEKMSRKPINDLREIIGINEKFLFINELFNGDMARYNKVIDELNAITNEKGLNRYFIELKIANQWPDDQQAFVKLQELVKRKQG